jgi:hypothetical protein
MSAYSNIKSDVQIGQQVPSKQYALILDSLCGNCVDVRALKKDKVNLMTWHRRFAHWRSGSRAPRNILGRYEKQLI